jgi:hypothetical protein
MPLIQSRTMQARLAVRQRGCGALVRLDDTIISRMAETASKRIVRM